MLPFVKVSIFRVLRNVSSFHNLINFLNLLKELLQLLLFGTSSQIFGPGNSMDYRP